MTNWNFNMDEAPRDGIDIQVMIPGNGADNVIAWQAEALLDSDGNWCGAWAFTRDQEPPDCWTDGYCWEVNEYELPSRQPIAWKLLTETSDD